MRFKGNRYLLVAILLAATLLSVAIYQFWYGHSDLQENDDILFQTSTISALLGGAYDGNMT
ncbi:MAG: alpha-acetolactate decarboxylase, partial [archaeon]|nr:alpha-acetolactate decarboxylase [archaeon]